MRTSRLRGCLCTCRCYSTGPTSSPAPLDPYNAFTTRFSSEPPESSTSSSSETSLSDLRISIKDNFATREGYTSCASKALESYSSPYDATVVQLLRQKGARIVGKTNMDEFGMGSYGIHSHLGQVRNPIDQERLAGGSSSGAAASVAADLCDVSIGSDTGGSVRLPASFTGTIGFKPSYGLLSRYGLVSYASSLDTVGILAKKVQHVKRVFDTLNVHDAKDPTAIPPSHRPKKSSRKSGKLRIGVPIECFPSELSKQAIAPTRRAIQLLRSTGADVVSVSIPSITRALSAYYTIASSEASSNLAKYDGIRYGFRSEGTHMNTRTAAFGEEVQKRIILGTYALTAEAFDNYFLAAQRLRNELKRDIDKVMRIPNPLCTAEASESGVDLLVFPSAISYAPTREDINVLQGEASTDSYVQDILTVPASLAGLPALSYPVPIEGMLPVGVQLVSQWGSDDLVLQVASQLEDAVIAHSKQS